MGAALLALWIDTRVPKLAPQSFSKRMVAAACALLAVVAMPVFNGSAAAIYATLFAIVLPVLICSFLTALWLLRTLRDTQLSH
jgi:hypothetical protein